MESNNWEKRFYNFYWDKKFHSSNNRIHYKEFVEFISQEIEKAREEGRLQQMPSDSEYFRQEERNRILALIDEIKRPLIKDADNRNSGKWINDGFNQALEAIKDKLQ